MECGKQNIKIVEGNEFALVLPLKQRTFVASTPIDEDIVYADLQDVVLKIGDTQFTATLETYGVQVLVPYDALTRGTYDILLTATYHGSVIRASYFEALTIVQYNSQSDAQQYIAGSPIVLDAAFVIGGPLIDEELEELKEEYREKNAQLQQAIEDAEAAKAEWEQKASDLEGVAKEATSQDILTAVENIDIDTSDLAKEATLQGVGADAAAAKTAAQNAETAAGQAKTAAEAAQTAVSALPTLPQIIQALIDEGAIVYSYNGCEYLPQYSIGGITDVIFYYNYLTKLVDNDIRIISDSLSLANGAQIKYIEWGNVDRVERNYIANGWGNIEEVHIPKATYISMNYFCRNSPALKVVDITNAYVFGGTDRPFSGTSVNLIDIRIGKNFTTSQTILNNWSPTNALDPSSSSLVDSGETFANNLEKLLYNIREHIAANLPDRTGQSALTLTMSAAVKAAIQADTATSDAFTNKNWIIA